MPKKGERGNSTELISVEVQGSIWF
jgi:hypothetical protein